MMLTCLGDVQARICNAGLPDEAAEKMIDDACQKAADEVRERLTHARNVEKDLYAMRRERDKNQQLKADSERLRLENERQESLERTAVLKAAEDKNGPRRGHSGSGW